MKTALTFACLLALPAFAADAPLLGVPGKLIYENTLAAKPEGWTSAKGKWEAAEGALCGAEQEADHHGAVIRKTMPLKDFIIQFEVRLDGARGTSLSINDPKGHLARISVAPGNVRVAKDDHDHEGPDKAVTFGLLKADLQPGTWHSVRMEIVGSTLVGCVDDNIAVCGTHEQLCVEKSNLGFTVAGQTASFRNLKIWEATPNPAWDSVKASLPKGEPMPVPAARPAAGAAKKPAVGAKKAPATKKPAIKKQGGETI